MKKSTLISIIALLASLIAVLVALVAYFKKRSCTICDDLDDMIFDEDYLEDCDDVELDAAPLPEEEPAQ